MGSTDGGALVNVRLLPVTEMNNCLFCGIAGGGIPADIVRSNERVVVFRDVNPQAPVHVLAIPRDHVANVGELIVTEPELVGELINEGAAAAHDLGVTNGYRVVFNTGPDGGQTVGHVHAHILGGRQLGWPPG